VPDTATLTLIRTPMVWMAVGVVVLLYLLGRILGGPAAGLAAGAVALTSGLSQSVLVRARNDCPLAFFLLLALLIGVLGGRRGRCGALPLVWAVALGVALGLAYAAKLTALLGLLATAAWECVVAASAWQRAAPASSARFQAAWAAGSGWLVAVAVGLGVFVLANPHLWPNPVEHMGHMFQHRTRQMRSHQRNFSAAAVHDLLQRPRYVLQSSLVEATWGGSRGVPLEALAAGIGCLALLARTGRAYRSGRVLPAEGLVLMTAVTYFAGVSAFLYVRFNLYFLPTFMLVALLSGPGLSTGLGSVHDRAVKWRVTRSA
jgi:4-amino-4-deoxy-L-arabinose transferase-like glycosyltransferase